MHLRHLKSFWPLLVGLLVLAVYWPSMNGLPIWDDLHFLFYWNVTAGDFSYLSIFRDFAWPVSVSLERFLYQTLGHGYFWHHLLNVTVHGLNSWLLFLLMRRLKAPSPVWIALFFLFHPANVISVSWMIQLKTLVCFTFAILSLHALLSSSEKKRWYLISCFLFSLSLLSKSASLPLISIILAFIFHHRSSKRDLLWTLPFLMITSFSTYKVLKSPVTSLSLKQFESETFVATNTNDEVEESPEEKEKKTSSEEPNPNSWDFFLATNFYYFWQAMVPVDDAPIKGKLGRTAGVIEYGHLIFLVILLILCWKLPLRNYLLATLLMLSPFMGIIPATYMNITWVSDQHLYLALPFFLAFCVGALDKLPPQVRSLICGFLVVTGMAFTTRASSLYKNEISFYERSLKADHTNLPLYYNLATAYLRADDPARAYRTLRLAQEFAEEDPTMANSKYLPYIQKLETDLLSHMDK